MDGDILQINQSMLSIIDETSSNFLAKVEKGMSLIKDYYSSNYTL